MQASSVTRALWILDLIAHADRPVPLRHIAETLEIPKSTAHGILRDLVRERFLDVREPATYTIGIKAFEVGAAHLRTAGLDGLIAGELARLSRALDVTAHYAVLDGTEAVYLYKQDPPGPGVQLASSVGARLPSHLTAVGKCCLAWLEPAQATAHVASAAADDRAALAAELTDVRSRGYATDHGRVADGIECVAAPVFDAAGPKGAVGVSYLRGSASRVEDTFVEHVQQTAQRLTSILGGTPQ
ncbi:IclR family transcriptional regulator [Streptomyces sp. NPDC006393]|uniref:IclR family transcriptional regulator n=1 Tax=Streptomyces sp. NPDC006393 TaxID=3156763 RepID=UPI0033C3911C